MRIIIIVIIKHEKYYYNNYNILKKAAVVKFEIGNIMWVDYLHTFYHCLTELVQQIVRAP